MTPKLAVMSLLVVLAAHCSADPSDDTSSTTSPDEAPGVGLRHFSGLATVNGSYSGWEAFQFTGSQGTGADICQVRYTVADTAPRSDCPDCLWAFDLTTSTPGIEVESGEGCSGLGIATTEFEGLSFSYGWAASSGSYESVLMYQVGAYGWYPVSYATWDEPRFQYDWEMGLYYY